MRKLITLLATAALAAAPFAFAETAGNPNDVLQTVQPSENGGPTTLADADNSSAQPAAGSDMSSDAAKPVKKTRHHKKHCTKHCKSHHHKKKAAAPAAAPSDAAPAASSDTTH